MPLAQNAYFERCKVRTQRGREMVRLTSSPDARRRSHLGHPQEHHPVCPTPHLELYGQRALHPRPLPVSHRVPSPLQRVRRAHLVRRALVRRALVRRALVAGRADPAVGSRHNRWHSLQRRGGIRRRAGRVYRSPVPQEAEKYDHRRGAKTAD